ncbi:hypothetical protein N0V84_001078 [Fusarium piperis]|uniref:Uncharacterized protein n=1 Tax=Fusarium piperis TaxID=1435070 RepID=A0A9W8WM05_9HYPO|nr:hypothetical protein N0V84_001078 [Fusarium piperis]
MVGFGAALASVGADAWYRRRGFKEDCTAVADCASFLLDKDSNTCALSKVPSGPVGFVREPMSPTIVGVSSDKTQLIVRSETCKDVAEPHR